MSRAITVRLASLVFAALVAVASHADTGKNDRVAVSTAAEFDLPTTIGPLKYSGERTYPSPELGTSYSYRGPGVSLDIYVYDAGQEDIPDGIDAAAAQAEFASAKSAVLDNSDYSNAVLMTDDTITIGTTESVPAFEASFQFATSKFRFRSYLWLTAIHGYYVRGRLSLDEKLAHEFELARQSVLQELGSAIAIARR